MIKKLVLFLIRKKLKLKELESFQFANQKSLYDYYYFDDCGLVKFESVYNKFVPAGVSLNWLLNDECEIVKYEPLD
jgi:hypothetical protein